MGFCFHFINKHRDKHAAAHRTIMSSAVAVLWLPLLLQLCHLHHGMVAARHGPNAVRVNKCCEEDEVRIDRRCDRVNSSVASKLTITVGAVFYR